TAAAASAASRSAVLGGIDESLSWLSWYNPSRQLGNTASSTRARLAVVLAVAAVALCGCGASPDPLHEVVGAATKTLALSNVSYYVTLDEPRLFGPSLEVPGGRAAYDFRAGVGYEALTLQRRNGEKRTVYLDFLPAAVYVAPW